MFINFTLSIHYLIIIYSMCVRAPLFDNRVLSLRNFYFALMTSRLINLIFLEVLRINRKHILVESSGFLLPGVKCASLVELQLV